jgi:O-antigen/teichoic acid export membrane protein
MPYGAKIAKNAAWLMFATSGQKLVAFFAFIAVARLLGKELTGVYFYAISITSIFVTLSDLGMTPVVIRAIAGDRADSARLFSAAIRAKLFLSPVAIIAALAYAIFFGADRVTLITVAIACLVMTADTFHLVLYGALRGRQNLKPEAVGMFLGQVITATLAVSAAWFGFGPVGLAAALLAGSSWNVIWGICQIKKFQISFAEARRKDFSQLAREALPFGIAGISVKVYSYVDSLFLNIYHGSAAVGLYAVAYKLTYALQFLPITFTAALYPALAAVYARKERDELRNTFLGSLRLMAAISFPISAGLSALAAYIIPLLYGQDFVGAVPAFQILPWVLIPIFLDFPIGSLLNASHKAHLKTCAMVATMLINFTLNAVLVPQFGTVGAAWAGVVSFWCLYFIGAYFSRYASGGVKYFIWLTVRSLFAAAVSWLVWDAAAQYFPLILAAIIGAAASILLGFLVGFIRADDIRLFTRHLRPGGKMELVHE